ncbi:MAG: hypothetical protein VW625_03480, partial [Perlucidibaca sp.]
FVLSGGLALGLSTLIAGPENARAYLDALHHVSWQGSNWNASANGFLTRLLGGGETPALVSVPLSGAQATLLVWLAMIPVLHDMSRQLPRLPPSHQADFLFALTPPAMLLLSPLGWIYYFPMLLLSLLILWQYSANLPGRTTRRLCLLLAITMTSLPRDLLPAAEPGDWRGVLLDAGLPTYALIILLLTGLRMLRDHARYGSSASAPR